MGRRNGNRFGLYCTCGASCVGFADDIGRAFVLSEWSRTHNKPGCSPCSSSVASRNRRKKEDAQTAKDHKDFLDVKYQREVK